MAPKQTPGRRDAHPITLDWERFDDPVEWMKACLASAARAISIEVAGECAQGTLPQTEYERIASHGLPLGVVVGEAFDSGSHRVELHPGDMVYAYTDGLTEAENRDGEMWGTGRLEQFLGRCDLPTPRLPALIDAVLQHVDQAPASDDISIVELEAGAAAAQRADAA